MFLYVIVSFHRKQKQGTNLIEKNQAVLNCNVYTDFWITWTDEDLRVGTGRSVGSAELMRYKDSTMSSINSMYVSTGFGATGTWKLLDCFEGIICIL